MAILQDRIKERRLILNLTLAEVAEKIGVREATVQRYESGEIKNIKHETIYELSKILDCSPAYLMGWQDEIHDISKDNAYNETEQVLISFFKQLDNDSREKVITYTKDLLRASNFERENIVPLKVDKHGDDELCVIPVVARSGERKNIVVKESEFDEMLKKLKPSKNTGL